MPVQIFCVGPKIYLRIVSQAFCARQNDDLHSVKLIFCAGTKVFEEALNSKYSQIFGLTQTFWTGTKHFATCKRTRQ